MNPTLKNLMLKATQLTRAGRLHDATLAIQRALGGAGGEPATQNPPGHQESDSRPDVSPAREGRVFEMERDVAWPRSIPLSDQSDTAAAATELRAAIPPADAADQVLPPASEFISGTHSHASKIRAYKLFVPAGHLQRESPLIVMLHGCSQDPDDFAAGTGMNLLAEERGLFVLYPAQPRSANSSRCWNWFRQEDQRRDAGEPASIAATTLAVMDQYGIDPRRVYVAGLSAGGAMASIVATTYPEIFAAAGVHSGLSCGAASSVLGAFSAMRSGNSGSAHQSPVPTIVFHGDRDRTVHPRNGEYVIASVSGSDAGEPNVEQGTVAQGRSYTRSTFQDAAGESLAEHWLVHGAGHAWSGGRVQGSYTDGRGPDATREMVRFFMEHPRRL